MTANEAIRPAEPNDERSSPRGEIPDWLQDLLHPGRTASQEVRSEASLAGFAWRTVQRADKEAGVVNEARSFLPGYCDLLVASGEVPSLCAATRGGSTPEHWCDGRAGCRDVVRTAAALHDAPRRRRFGFENVPDHRLMLDEGLPQFRRKPSCRSFLAEPAACQRSAHWSPCRTARCTAHGPVRVAPPH